MLTDWQRTCILEAAEDKWGMREVEILGAVDVAWSAWECDDMVALVRRPGHGAELLVVHAVGTNDPSDVMLRGRIEEYRRLIGETEALLALWERERKSP